MTPARSAALALAFAALCAAPLAASAQAMVGGAPMYSSKNIVENASHSKDHTTLMAAVKAAGLDATLKGKGPFTVFAPVNAAFARLPAGTVDKLLQPDSKADLSRLLSYHVVMGKMDTAALAKAIDAGGGKAELTAVSGGTLTATRRGRTIRIADESGHTAKVTVPDVIQSNGVIHVVDTVLMPK